jgi:hypothetical protein
MSGRPGNGVTHGLWGNWMDTGLCIHAVTETAFASALTLNLDSSRRLYCYTRPEQCSRLSMLPICNYRVSSALHRIEICTSKLIRILIRVIALIPTFFYISASLLCGLNACTPALPGCPFNNVPAELAQHGSGLSIQD